MAASRKPAEEECEECPEWIFTFADLVMLMMGFFVILWVLKPPAGKQAQADTPAAKAQQDQWLDLVGQVRGAFGWEPDPTSTDPVDRYALRRHVAGPGDGSRREKERRGAHGDDPEVTSIRQGSQAVVGGKLLFNSDSAVLNRTATDALDQIVLEIRGHRNIVLIKGHASLDDLPTSATASQKMDLSLKRAEAVATYLIDHGVAPEILRIQGCSTFEPLIQRRYQPDAQSLNRRVEVVVTPTLVPQLQDPPPDAPEVGGGG
jgi:flagellar motor protein MotB